MTDTNKKVVACVLLLAIIPMGAAQEKVVVIGLDGASDRLMQQCLEEGNLPHITALAEEGSFTTMQSPLPPLTPVAISSFLTGKNPGYHGVYGFEKRTTLGYETTIVNGRHLSGILPDAVSGRSIMVNVPMTYPAPEIDGVVVSGFPGSTQGSYVYPPTLRSRLQEMDYQVTTAATFEDREQLEQEVFDLFEKRQTLTLDLMAEYDWNFTITMFTGDARLLHFEAPDGCTGAIKRYYEGLDMFVGEVRDQVEDDTTIILMSNHGFERLDKKIYMYTLLKEYGYLTPKTIPYYKHWIQAKIGDIAALLGLQEQGEISGRASFSSAYMDELDWDQTQAYTGAFYNGQIFINLKGREPNGNVPQEQYDVVRQNIIDDLKDVRDPETGERVFTSIYRKEDVYKGDRMDELPDIIVESPGYNHIARFGFGTTFLSNPQEKSTPVKEGFLIANRPTTVDSPTILDLSTTIAGLLGGTFGEGRMLFPES